MPDSILPNSPAPVSYKITSKVNTVKSESLSGRIMTRKVGGQRFEATLVFPPMNRNQFHDLHAFLMQQSGSNGIFYVEIPTFGDTHGAVGEYVNYDDHAKMYMVPHGEAAVYPEQLVAGGTIVPSVTYMRCSLRNNVQFIEYNSEGVVRMEVDVEERL